MTGEFLTDSGIYRLTEEYKSQLRATMNQQKGVKKMQKVRLIVEAAILAVILAGGSALGLAASRGAIQIHDHDNAASACGK